jgi:hypothetical protein
MKKFVLFKTLITLVIFTFLGCEPDNKYEIEHNTKLQLGNSLTVQEQQSLDAIGEGGLTIKFKIEDSADLNRIIEQIRGFDNYLQDLPTSINHSEDHQYWYRSKTKYVLETNGSYPHISFYIDSLTNLGAYSYFED